MVVLFDLIKKNFKVLIRSKSSALIIILGPLLVIFLVGIAFDNIGKYSLNIGTYSEEYSELAESFIIKLQEKEFKVQKIDSEELCIEQIKQGKLHTCIIFPEDLTIEAGKMNEIIFHVDYSKINLIWMVLDTISTKLKERSSELSLDLTADLLEKLESARVEIYNKKPTIVNLKTENQETTSKIEEFQTTLSEFKVSATEIRDYLLQKIIDAQTEIENVKTAVSDSNATDSQINVINMKISSVNTYLVNIHNKIEDPNDVNEVDWEKIIEQIDEVNSQIFDIKQKLSSSGTKINEIQESLDKIYTDLENIQIKEATTIVAPITTNIKPVVPQKTHLNYMFPSLIILVIMFISILLSTTIVMMEKHSPAYFRNFITPTKSITFITAIYLTNMILVLTQLIVIFAISMYFFKAQIIPSLPIVIPSLLLITTFFTFIGMFVGYIFTSEETATLASISVGSVFLFLSNVILPLESMPEAVRSIAQFNPFVLGEEILRKTIILQTKFAAIQKELIYLAIYSIILFALIWGLQKATRKHFFHRLTRKRKKEIKPRAK
jgi:ABC-type multidrug transport system permease subunit